MILPNFLVVGAQKCGTTSLHDILSLHPEANMSAIKEINYFINPKKYGKGLEYYSTFFAKQKSTVIGESSPGYLCYPKAASLIKKDLGRIKIIIILRDPVKRAFSQYWDNRRGLSESMTENEIIQNCLEENYIPGRRGYFSRGVYAPQISRYLDLFGDNNIKIIFLEELIRNETKGLHDIYEFLKIDKYKGAQKLPPPSNSAFVWDNPFYQYFFNRPHLSRMLPKHARRFLFFGNKSSYKYNMIGTRQIELLKEFYYPYNRDLELLISRKLPW